MPSQLVDQRSGSASSHYLDEFLYPVERQIGFYKSNSMSEHHREQNSIGLEGMVPVTGSKFLASSPPEKFSPIGVPSVDWLELRRSSFARQQTKNVGIGGQERMASFPEASWNSMNHAPKSWSNLSIQQPSFSSGVNKIDMNGIQSESSLFSSSLSDIFNRKMKISGNDVSLHQPFDTVGSHLGEESFESLKEIEAQTIGNLLPDEDDLFSGVADDVGHGAHTNVGDDLEEFDLFSSGGGMELEGDDRLNLEKKDFVGLVTSGQGVSNGMMVGEHPYGEHPSRTLFVRNINSNVEDVELTALFEHYGDIRTIYTACKHRGFVMVSYYDIRSARNAMRGLQNKPLRRRKLDIHYSIPKDNPSEKDTNQGTLVVFNLESTVSNDELREIFGVYGEIREIRETPHKRNHKFIEFFDVRAAEAALRALNRSDIAGKQIKLEPSRPGGARRSVPLIENELDELNFCRSPFDDFLLPGHMASPGVITSRCMDNGSTQVLNSVVRPTASVFTEPHQTSSVPINLPSPGRLTSIGSQFSLNEPNHSFDEMKASSPHIGFHPHSLPEYGGNIAHGGSYKSASTILDMASNVGPKITEGLHGFSSNGHLMEPNGGVLGSSGNGNYSLHGNHYVWNNSSQQHPSRPVVWPSSPSYLNGLHPNRVPHISGFPRVPTLMMNPGSPVNHHVGSAPAVNPSIWDRQHAFTGESPDASSFQLGSLGSVGFPGRSPSHPMEIASHNIFPHVGGMDITKSNGIPSPQQMGHLFPGRNPMVSMPSSFDSPNERVRNFSYRRNESNSNHADKKQYELDVDRIMRGDDNRTTLMIKNIPNKYTSKMLLAAIDEHCRGTYDFIYLPIDFKNKCNVGYAFINMVDPRQIIPFHQAFNGKKWEKFNSEKVASLAYARIQGKTALIAHFQNSSLMNEDKRCRPILFHTDGPNAGDPEPFPMGTNIRSRLGKPRTGGNEENPRQGNPSATGNGEESNGSESSGSAKDSD